MITQQNINIWNEYQKGLRRLENRYDRENEQNYPLPEPKLMKEEKGKVSYVEGIKAFVSWGRLFIKTIITLNYMEKELEHKNCGGKIEFKKEEHGCNDPECCGGISTTITLTCKKCGKEEDIY